MKLLLLKPSYDTCNYNFSNYPFINVLGNIKNKSEYCKLVQSCLCVLTTSYQETFGCIFAEAMHLGVPVIGDNSIIGLGSTVFKDVPSNYTTIGNPAKCIKIQ